MYENKQKLFDLGTICVHHSVKPTENIFKNNILDVKLTKFVYAD